MGMLKTGKNKKIVKITSFFSNLGLGEERDYFIENLSMLLSSGMDILTGLESVKQDLRSRRMKKILDTVKEEINAGSSIWRALQDIGILPAHTISLIRIGERAGRLAENLKVIVNQQQKERVFRSKIRSAMMYPILVLSITVVIGIGIAWFILPRLATVFAQLKIELPFLTKVLIALGAFLGSYGSIVVPLFLLAVAAIIYFVFIFSKTKFFGQALLIRLPGVKKLIQEVELARFGYILGTLLKAGLPIVDSVDSLYHTATFRSYKKFYSSLKNSIEEGNSFQKSFILYGKTKKIIPVPIQQMIVAAEQSGRLPETLIKIGQIYEEKTENTTKNLTVILEPILLIIVWLGVLAVALAVILPIYRLIGGLNQGSTVATPVESNVVTTPTEELEKVKLPKIEILSTVATLNVRNQPSAAGVIINRVHANEVYEYKDEQNGWYKIILSEGETGWVMGRYVREIE